MSLDETIQRMHTNKVYVIQEKELIFEKFKALDKIFEYNHLKPSMYMEKQALLKEMFAEIGEGCFIETPFHANWGCKNVHFGNHIYANFNLTMVDATHIYVGDHVMFGPNVVLASSAHPVDPELRK